MFAVAFSLWAELLVGALACTLGLRVASGCLCADDLV
jgi:hypothetical protein